MIDLRLAVTDQVVGDQAVKIKCREHNDKITSLAVYADNINCFGCGFHLNLEGRDKPGYRDPLAYLLKVEHLSPEEVAKYTNEALDRYRDKAAQEARMDPLPKSLATIYNSLLNSTARRHRMEWFFARGLNRQTINHPEIMLGHNGTQFVIPIFDREGHLVSLRYRMDPDYCTELELARHKYIGMKGRNGLYLYPERLIDQMDYDYLYVCEGELDAIRMWQQYLPAVTVTNGAGQVEKIPALLKEHYPKVKKLILATDQDEPGEEAAQRTIKVAQSLGFEAARLYWEGGKDVTEHLLLKEAA